MRKKNKWLSVFLAAVLVVAQVLTSMPMTTYAASVEMEAAEQEIAVASTAGRKWVTLTGAAKGGHAYGQASGPMFYHPAEENMVSGRSISMALEVTGTPNFGIFYSYIDDSNWLYIGYDSSSKWYYQYSKGGSGSYPAIAGLPDPVAGEEFNLTIALNNETLEVAVNDTLVRTTNQALKDYANDITTANESLGKFGVMTKTSTISFADFVYNGEDLMENDWAFLVERDGQTAEATYTAMVDVAGKVVDEKGNPLADATVRIGTYSATTDAEGNYTLAGVQIGEYTFSASKPGYLSYTETMVLEADGDHTKNVTLQSKEGLDLEDQTKYDVIESDVMKVYVGKDFPKVVRYVMKDDPTAFFRANETELNEIVINGVTIQPTVTAAAAENGAKTYELNVVDEEENIDLDMTVVISVKNNTLTWKVTELTKNAGCERIATIDIPQLNLLTVDASESDSVFAGAKASTDTTAKADTYITFADGFVPENTDGYLYGFLTNGKLSAGLHSNSEAEGDKRVERINTADSMSLTSAAWYYENGDKAGNNGVIMKDYVYPLSELPEAKVAIAGDLNDDGIVNWNDGAIAFRDVMHYAQDYEVMKDAVNYRIVMNFASSVGNPFLKTADNIKKVYLATDGLPQGIVLKGYGNEGHDSANSEYADIAEREGGVEDMQDLIKIAHDYRTQIGIHVNAQEIYQESRSMNEAMVTSDYGYRNGNGWGWLDQSVVINKLWDLASNARLKRFVQLYDRLNETNFYSRDWDKGEYVKESEGFFTNGDGVTEVSREEVLALIKADAATRPDNMDMIYLDVWYQDSWETRRIAEEINSLGWRFSTEFSAQGEYDSTWQHWSTEASYGGNGAKGLNSDIIRFLRNDQRDSNMINYPPYGGSADNPLISGFELYGFEGWGSNQDFTAYVANTFRNNVPSRFLQHYEIVKWVNYADEGEVSPVGNTEKEITLKNDEGDVLVVTRNEAQRSDSMIERTMTLNGKVVLNTDTKEHTYLLPWTIEDEEEKLYHWNEDGGTTTWELQDDWAGLANVVVYELSDQGRLNEKTVSVSGGKITLEAKADTAYVVLKGENTNPIALKADFGECDYVVDPGFNGYASGDKLDAADWTGDITADGVSVVKNGFGNQKLVMDSVTKTVEVSTEINGLETGKKYVAEIYVENKSDAKAIIEVDAGEAVVSNYTIRSIAQNFHRSDAHNTGDKLPDSRMQRMMVVFTAESDKAVLSLSREAGEGITSWDDIRIVQKDVDNFKESGTFEQDFETVVEGIYPFVVGPAQGVDDVRTHLSQSNGKFTSKGWNSRIIDDTIEGDWSVKHHARNTGIIYQTIPQNFRFEPGMAYIVEFDYQAGSSGYQMVVGDGYLGYQVPTEYLEATTAGTQHVSMTVVGSSSGQTWIGLYENADRVSEGAWGQMDFILDNLRIRQAKDAVLARLDRTEALLGETIEIQGSNLDQVTWSVNKEGIVEIDQENNLVKAIGTGNVTVTAAYPDGTDDNINVVIKDYVVETLTDADSFGSVEVDTAEENHDVSKAFDGDPSTYWRSTTLPATLTVTLKGTSDLAGFSLTQSNDYGNGVHGIISTYSYTVTKADGSTVESEIINLIGTGSWAYGGAVNVEFDEVIEDVVEIAVCVESAYVAEGNPYATIAETAITIGNKVSSDVTITGETKEIEVDGTVQLNAEVPEGTVAAGLVWTSSNPAVATVDENGLVTGVGKGNVTITVSNATGTLDTCEIKVAGDAETPSVNTDALEAKITEAESIVTDTYTEASVKALSDAIKAAKAAVDAAESQEAVDAAKAALEAAIEGLTCAHTSVKIVGAKYATCTEAGYTGDKVCEACDKTVEKGKVIEALGHDFPENWTVVKEPTVEAEGLEERQCTRCDVKQERAIDKLVEPDKEPDKEPDEEPDEPSQPEQPQAPTAPATGDTAEIFTWIATAFVMAAGMIGFSVKRRKNR